ncbi:MAG: glycosyltransferase family 4 protein [Fermentimonas sp.]|jgi:glycosyltransferase involved in cell wall biosynthesis
MNVLFISTSDLRGGAAIAAYRLMKALQASGIDVKMLVREKLSDDDNVIKIGNNIHNKYNFYKERADIFLRNGLKRGKLFDVSIANTGISITKMKEFEEADIVHLHWINQGMLSLKEIGRIVESDKKVVWTMHDMWPFTGICHHATTCNNYHTSCGHCKYLQSSFEKDLSQSIFSEKLKVFNKSRITFVACSKWLKEQAVVSPLTHNHKVVSIPNPIDTKVYSPGSKEEARKRLQLPQDKKLILFAAMKASDKRKGMDHLVRACNILATRGVDIDCVIAGENGTEMAQVFNLPVHAVGWVSQEKMKHLYTAVDLFVTPSLQENLPNTIMEAMACGTPCVGFNIGGIPEMIDHGRTGYVAKYKDYNDLANGIYQTLYESDKDILSANARQKVLDTYSQEVVSRQYIDIFNQP